MRQLSGDHAACEQLLSSCYIFFRLHQRRRRRAPNKTGPFVAAQLPHTTAASRLTRLTGASFPRRLKPAATVLLRGKGTTRAVAASVFLEPFPHPTSLAQMARPGLHAPRLCLHPPRRAVASRRSFSRGGSFSEGGSSFILSTTAPRIPPMPTKCASIIPLRRNCPEAGQLTVSRARDVLELAEAG